MERRFRVTVRGRLDADFGLAFGDVRTSSTDEVSCLSGTLVDAAFLDGILSRLRDLGLELVRVETSGGPGDEPPDTDGSTKRGDGR
jgi:hypothetical protein